MPGRIFAVVLLMGMAAAFSAGIGVMQRPAARAFPDPDPGRPSPRPYTLPLRFAEWVIRYCDETGAPVWIAARLFSWESGWNAAYRGRENDNGTHDLGLAALNSSCLDDFRKYNDGAEVDPFDAETAIRVGVRYLAALHSDTGSWRAAVGAYNVGLGAWRAGARPVRHLREVFGE